MYVQVPGVYSTYFYMYVCCTVLHVLVGTVCTGMYVLQVTGTSREKFYSLLVYRYTGTGTNISFDLIISKREVYIDNINELHIT